MTEEVRHIIDLFQRRLRGEILNAEETRLLEQWITESVYTQGVSDLFSNETQFDAELRKRLSENYAEDYQKIRAAIGAWGQISASEEHVRESVDTRVDPDANTRPVHRVH